MSTRTSIPLPLVDRDSDFVQTLLREQQSMTAVERFSRDHETAAEHTEESAQGAFYRRLMPATGPGPNQQFAFEVALDSCSGCKACVVACHTLNGLEDQEVWRRVGILVGEGTVQHVTTACHHCEDPGCLKGCPVKAYVKDETTGVVRHLDDQCIGCKYCTMMCPYEVPQYSERLGIVRKCDMCHQRLQAGEAPACVQACPNEAIRIRVVDRDTHGSSPTAASPGFGRRPTRGSATIAVSRLTPGAPDSSLTRPTTSYLSQLPTTLQATTPQDAAVDRVAESHWPLAVMLVGTQAAIGLLVVEQLAAWAAKCGGEVLPGTVTRGTAALALLLAAIGLHTAPLHLGQPLKAWRVFLGLRTSWLSREAILLGGFFGLLCAATAVLWRPVPDWLPVATWLPMATWLPGGAGRATLAASLAFGLAGLYASAMVYIATGRSLWRTRRTLPRFAGSAVCLGLTGFAWVGSIASEPPMAIVPIALLGLAANAAKIAFETATHYAAELQAAGLERADTTQSDASAELDVRSARLAMGPLRKWVQCRRWAAAVAMLSLAAAALLGSQPDPVQQAASAGDRLLPTACLAAAFVLTLVGDFAERILYFASVVYDRMPGTLR